MAVAAVNLTIDRGIDFSIALKLKSDGAPINLAGYGFSCVMKKHYTATVGYGFSVSPLSPISNGVARIQMHRSITSNIPTGRYVFDLIIINPDGDNYKSAEGNVIVKGTAS